ncbi:MAG: energy-coupling factor transporter ATPase [Desulfurococcaceae archaeon]
MVKVIIDVDDLTYYYPRSKTPALVNVNLKVEEGEFVIIAGPSGGGKSTLCKILTGLIPHSYGGEIRGKVYVNGINVIEKGPRAIIGLIGAVFQVPENQIVNLTVEEELAFALENLGVEPGVIKERINEVVKRLELEHLRRCSTVELSGGEAQKVLIASTLVLKPRILLLDEPLAHLDPYSSLNLIRLLNELHKVEKITIIVFEHRLSELVKYADKLVVLNKRVIMSGEPREVVRELIKSNDHTIEIPLVAELSYKLGMDNIPLDIDEFIHTNRYLNDAINHVNSVNSSYAEENPYVSTEKIITINNLWYIYPNNKVALRNINLEIHKGEIVVLVGANGAGKTTLLKHLNGLLKPSKGAVYVYGHDTRTKSIAELSNYVGIVFQNPLHQFFEETVIDEVLAAARIRNIPNAYEKAVNLLKFFNLEQYVNKSPFELSVGEQRRLAIASILIYDPPVLVFDEPTAGLDKGWRNELSELINQLNLNGKTIIVATHDIEFLTSLRVSKVVVMNNGGIVAQGSPRNVLYQQDVLLSSRVVPPQIVKIIMGLSLSNRFRPLRANEFLELINIARCENA